jgi:hypothetical protein
MQRLLDCSRKIYIHMLASHRAFTGIARVVSPRMRPVRCHAGATSPVYSHVDGSAAVAARPVEAHGARSIGPRSPRTPPPLQ